MKINTAKGATQKLMLPIAEELAQAGHTVLAVKLIMRATIVDITILNNRKAAIRRTAKLTKAAAKLMAMEAVVCNVMHNHHEEV